MDLNWTGANSLGPIAVLIAVSATCAFIAGVVGYFTRGVSIEDIHFAAQFEAEQIAPRLFADWYAHNASYDVGFVGGVVLAFWILRQRRLRSAVNSDA